MSLERLSISNLAWEPAEDAVIAGVLRDLGIRGVEVAPTKYWKDPTRVSDAAAETCRRFWLDYGIQVVAFQSLLFGHPEFQLFGDESSRRAMLEHLRGVMGLAARLGAGPLVFGSPEARIVGAMDPAEAWDVAVAFFRAAGEAAARAGVTLCIEPNPAAYQCEFVTTVAEGRRLVESVGHPDFRLHVDTAAMELSGEAHPATVEAALPVLRHFHVSEPQLAPVGDGTIALTPLLDAAASGGYQHWVSIEMLSRSTPAIETVPAAIARVRDAIRPG